MLGRISMITPYVRIDSLALQRRIQAHTQNASSYHTMMCTLVVGIEEKYNSSYL